MQGKHNLETINGSAFLQAGMQVATLDMADGIVLGFYWFRSAFSFKFSPAYRKESSVYEADSCSIPLIQIFSEVM